MSITELKKLSLEQLKGYWNKAIGVSAIYLIVTVFLQEMFKNSTIFTSLFESIITAFFSLGMIAFLFNVIKKQAQVNDMFSQSNIWLKGIAITFILGAPSIVLMILSGIFKLPTHDMYNAGIIIFWVIVTIVFVVATIAINLMFGLSSTILVDNPDISVINALKKSSELMKGQKIRYILLCLSFLGWIFLAVITLGIGFLWLVPYMQLAIVNFYIDLKNKKA